MYDPLAHSSLEANQSLPDSYWANHTAKRLHFPALAGQHKTNVVVIGGGYTGLSTAIELRKRGVEVTLLEANCVGWGCAGRNAGFVLPGSGRLGYTALKERYGETAAKGIIDEFYTAPESLRKLIEQEKLDVDLTNGGYLKIAHKPAHFEAFKQQFQALPETFKSNLELLTPRELSTQLLNTEKQFGGLYNRSSFGINPLKMATAMAELLRASGGVICHNSPVTGYQKQGNHYKVTTANGEVICDKVVLASNAYTPNRSISAFYKNQFPVLSSILVTHPLDKEQLTCFKQDGLLCMDTRALKYYYRLLPDNRVLFGGRGAVWGRNHDSPLIKRKLLQALKGSFPTLSDARIDYYWSGWVSVPQDEVPHVGSLPNEPDVFYAMGYCGSGVAYTHTAGKRIAQLITNPDEVPDLPIYRSFPKAFPFAPFRRLGLWGYYQWQGMQDWF